MYIYINVHVLQSVGHDSSLIRALVVILNYKTYSGTCQEPLYTAQRNIFELFYVLDLLFRPGFIKYLSRLYKTLK